jgi:MFS family permease
MTLYKLQTKKPPTYSLMFLVCMASVVTVFLSPTLPSLKSYFNVSIAQTQRIISTFLIGYAIGQLIYSPFANRFGRRKTIFIGLTAYFIGCIISIIATYSRIFSMLAVGSWIITLGASVGMTLTFTIINDYYFPQKARKITSYVVTSFSFMPSIAIIISGIIITNYSPIYCFYFLVFYGIILMILSVMLPETLESKNIQNFSFSPIFATYAKAFTSYRLVYFSIIFGMASSIIYLIATTAPFIAIDYIKISPRSYALLLILPYLGQLIGSLYSGKFSHRHSSYFMMMLGVIISVIGSIIMLISFILSYIHTITLIGPLVLVMMGIPMIYSNASVLALSEHQDKASGSAVMSFITMITCVIITSIYTSIFNKIPYHMPQMFLIVLVILSSLIFLTHKIKTIAS